MYQVKQFWEKWCEVNELDQELLVETLPICGDKWPKTIVSLLNSYFVDLHEYVSSRLEIYSVETIEGMIWDANRYYHDADEHSSYSMFVAEWIVDSIKQGLYSEESDDDLDPLGCVSCGEDMPLNECTNSKRECGHHCNHSWEQDECCWCGKKFGEYNENNNR